MEDLSQFISKQRAAGTVESAGGFTLSIEKARAKLGQYFLAHQEDYLLKIIQCASSAGAQDIHIELSRTRVICHFELDLDNTVLSAGSLADSLVGEPDGQEPASKHLSVALCVLAAQGSQELMWGDWDGSTDGGIILSLGHGRSEIFRRAPFPRIQPLPAKRRFHLLFFTRSTPQSWEKERQLLHSRCSLAPLNIKLNQRKLAACLPIYRAPADSLQKLSELYVAQLSATPDPQGKVRWPQADPKSSGTPHKFLDFGAGIPPVLSVVGLTKSQGQEFHRLKELFAVPSLLYGPSLLHYIQDGVLMKPRVIHEVGAGAMAILDGTGLETDLTGLQLVDSPTILEDAKRAVEIWKEQINSFLDTQPPILKSSKRPNFLKLLASIRKRSNQDEEREQSQRQELHRHLLARRSYTEFFK